MKRRVVVTGLGCLTPVGNDVRTTWQNLLSGVSGIDYASLLDLSTLPVKILGEVKGFALRDYLCGESMAGEDAGIAGLIRKHGSASVGVSVGVGGSYPDLDQMRYLYNFSRDKRWDKEAFARQARIPAGALFQRSPHTLSCLIAKLWKAGGPNLLSQTACASAGHAIGQAFRLIRYGAARAMIAGGADAITSHLQVAAFVLLGALSTRATDPAKASRPFDAGRDGFVYAEGGAMLILEDLASARERGARIYGEIVGFGSSANAYRVTDFPKDGQGPHLAIERALADAAVAPEEVDYICAHGTATTQNDIAETQAIKRVLGTGAYRTQVSSIKSCIGHLISGAGGINAIAALLATRDNLIPPTINLENPDPLCDLDYTPGRAREKAVRYALSNAFGFGGQNSCLIFKKYHKE